MAHELLRLEHIRGDHIRFRSHRLAQGLPVGVDDRDHIEALEVSDQGRIEVWVHIARKRPGEHHDRGPTRQVEELVSKQFHLACRDGRSAFVDLRLLARRRVEHRGVRAGLIADAHEVVQDRLLRELLDDMRPRCPARKPGRDHGLSERLERTCDVDALAARHRALIDGSVTAPESKVRNGERLVDRRVERDRDDHRGSLFTFRRARAANGALACTGYRLAEPGARTWRSSTDLRALRRGSADRRLPGCEDLLREPPGRLAETFRLRPGRARRLPAGAAVRARDAA